VRRSTWCFCVLLAAAIVAVPVAAPACSCTNNLTTAQEFDYAWMVFSGRVLAVQPDPFGSLTVVLEPIQRWKGPLGYQQVVVTPDNPGTCGYLFEIGKEYLVFATMTYYGLTLTPTPFTHLCSRTSLLAGNPYLAELPPPLVTTAASRPSWGTLKVRYR
jgi:hypothetical protein